MKCIVVDKFITKVYNTLYRLRTVLAGPVLLRIAIDQQR